jgi:hypothetical protein
MAADIPSRAADRDLESLTHGQSFAIAKDRYRKAQT